jgi:hypothetical protein
MELLQRDERRGRIACHCLGQQTPVGSHGFAGIFGRKSKVQFTGRIFRAIGAAHSANPGTEAGPQPGKVPTRNRQPPDTVAGNSRLWRGTHKFLLLAAVKPGRTHLGYSLPPPVPHQASNREHCVDAGNRLFAAINFSNNLAS